MQPLWRTVLRFLEKLQIVLPYDPGIPLLVTYQGKIIIQKDVCMLMFTIASFTIAKTQKQPQYPLTENG